MDVAKTGNTKERRAWKKKGYDLYAHNYGSSDIYQEENKDYDEIVRILIRTHGLIGQYIRGEVKFIHNKELYPDYSLKIVEKEFPLDIVSGPGEEPKEVVNSTHVLCITNYEDIINKTYSQKMQ